MPFRPITQPTNKPTPGFRPINQPPNKTPEQIKQETQSLVQKGEEAKKYMEAPWYKKIFSKQFAKELPGAVADVLAKTPVKFGLSATEIPETLIKGKATDREYNIPLLGGIKSYQTEAQARAEKIRAGEQSRWTALAPFAEVPLAGLETFGIIKGTQKTIQKGAQALTKKAGEKALKETLEITSPVLNKKGSIQALEKAGQPGGAKIKGLTKKIVVEPTKEDIKIAQSVQGLVSKNKSPVKNLENVNKKISEISEKQVKPFLQQNPRAFTMATLEKKLKDIEPPDIIKSDQTLSNTYELIRNRMIKVADKSKKTMEGLWESRKMFDDEIDKQFGDVIFNSEKNTAIKRGILDMRRAVNEFIGDKIGDNTFKEFMGTLSDMYSARHNIAEKAYKLLNTTGLSRFFKSHPLLKKTLQIGIPTGGAGYAASKIIGD